MSMNDKPGFAHRTGKVLAGLALCAVAALPLAARAQDQGQFGRVIRIDRNAFGADAGQITFSEYPLKTRNPVYRPEKYGAAAGGTVVTFGGFYTGQRVGERNTCPKGANPEGCILGKPSAPLRLDPRAPVTFTADDGANPNSPSLSGSPQFNGAVSILFSRDLAGVGLAGGFFNAVRSTAIQAYDRQGNLIGGVKNIGKGMEYLALVTEDGANRIAGIQFSLVGPEPAGYAIDDLSFAFATQLNRENVPGLADILDEFTEEAQPEPAKPSLGDLFGEIAEEANEAAEGGGASADAGKGSLSDLFSE